MIVASATRHHASSDNCCLEVFSTGDLLLAWSFRLGGRQGLDDRGQRSQSRGSLQAVDRNVDLGSGKNRLESGATSQQASCRPSLCSVAGGRESGEDRRHPRALHRSRTSFNDELGLVRRRNTRRQATGPNWCYCGGPKCFKQGPKARQTIRHTRRENGAKGSCFKKANVFPQARTPCFWALVAELPHQQHVFKPPICVGYGKNWKKQTRFVHLRLSDLLRNDLRLAAITSYIRVPRIPSFGLIIGWPILRSVTVFSIASSWRRSMAIRMSVDHSSSLKQRIPFQVSLSTSIK